MWRARRVGVRSPGCGSEYAFCIARFIVEKLASTPAGGLVRILGNTGAPVCVGDRLRLTWLSVPVVVVFPPDNSALASARNGTRS